jgi:hypothetical protein
MISIILVHGVINIHRVSFLFHLYRNSQANRRDEPLGESFLSRVLVVQDANESEVQAPHLEDLVRDSRKNGSPADANAMSGMHFNEKRSAGGRVPPVHLMAYSATQSK